MQYKGPFYHGSYEDFAIGMRLSGRGQDYHDEWMLLSYYEALHMHRPADCLAHSQAVFFCDNIQDIDNCGGATEMVVLVRPVGAVSRHDMNWGARIDHLLGERKPIDHPEVRAACLSYWRGEATASPVWEYIAPEAVVLATAEWADPEAEAILAEFYQADLDLNDCPAL